MGAVRKRLRWFAAGVMAALLFDPARGRARRARLRDQSAALLRRLERRTARRSRYLAHWARGMASRLSARPHDEPADDRTLVDKVRSPPMSIGYRPDSRDEIVRHRGKLEVTPGSSGAPSAPCVTWAAAPPLREAAAPSRKRGLCNPALCNQERGRPATPPRRRSPPSGPGLGPRPLPRHGSRPW
jgi:hypothetical protein